jgi:hypothetical protein
MGNPILTDTRLEYLKVLITETCILLDKLDNAFEGMIDDVFVDGWFTFRKIKGRH